MSLYEIEGSDIDGPVLIALPGMGGTAFTFPMEAFEPLHNAGVRVLFASYNNEVDSMEAMGRAVWEAVLLANIDREVILLGYSIQGSGHDHAVHNLLHIGRCGARPFRTLLQKLEGIDAVGPHRPAGGHGA